MTSRDETLWARWSRLSEEIPAGEAIVHLKLEEPPRRYTWRELLVSAKSAASFLKEKGVRRGDVCALIFRHRAEVYPLYLGVCALGAIPSILAYPNARLHPAKFVQGLSGMSRRSGLDWLLTERSLESTIAPLISGPGSSIREMLFPLEWGERQVEPHFQAEAAMANDAGLLQHSSGTTGLQKAVVLSHRAILDHVERYAEAIGLNGSDRIVSWLPLYHDMGLIAAFHLPLAYGITTILLDPFEWVSAPYLLLEALWKERGSITWLPNFAYNLMADRVHDDEMEGVDLSAVRLYINCSEPIRSESHAKFLRRFERYGVRAEALSASYAMAEATFAVTQTRPGVAPRELVVSRDALARGTVVAACDGLTRVCVASGRPVRGCQCKLVDEFGQELGEGRVGEILIQSDSLFEGYRNDVERTRDCFANGWYKTGDYGFLWEGELFVTGRKKDLIIVAGKNLYPEDIEDAVGSVAGVVPGRVVAFGTEDETTGTELVCVVAETAVTGLEARKALQVAIIRAAMAIDVTVARVVLVPPRWLVKSSSGKLSRQANRERVLAGSEEVLTEIS